MVALELGDQKVLVLACTHAYLLRVKFLLLELRISSLRMPFTGFSRVIVPVTLLPTAALCFSIAKQKQRTNVVEYQYTAVTVAVTLPAQWLVVITTCLCFRWNALEAMQRVLHWWSSV